MPTTTNYIWDEQNYLAEADGSNVIQAVYTNEPQQYGNLISTRISVTTSYHHFDSIGSTRQLTNSVASVTDSMIYDAWGNVVNRSGSTGTYRLWIGQVGYYYDTEIAFHWISMRPYSPTVGRWVAVDPLTRARLFLAYTYANNSPVVRIDPSGLCSICSITITAPGSGTKRSDGAFWDAYVPNQIFATMASNRLAAAAKLIIGNAVDTFTLRPGGDTFPELPFFSKYGLYDAVLPPSDMLQLYMFAYFIDYCNDGDGECLFQAVESGDTDVSKDGRAWKPAKGADVLQGFPDDALHFTKKPMLSKSGEPTWPVPADFAPGPDVSALLGGPLKQPVRCDTLEDWTCKKGSRCNLRAVLFDAVFIRGYGDPNSKIDDSNHITVFRQRIEQVITISDDRGPMAIFEYDFTFGRKNAPNWGVQLTETATRGPGPPR